MISFNTPKVALSLALIMSCSSLTLDAPQEAQEIRIDHYSDGPRVSHIEARSFQYARKTPCQDTLDFIQPYLEKQFPSFQRPEANVECRSFTNKYRRISVNWEKRFLALQTTDVTQFATYRDQQIGGIIGETNIRLIWNRYSVEIHDPSGHIETISEDPAKGILLVESCWHPERTCQNQSAWHYRKSPPEYHSWVNAKHDYSYFADFIGSCLGLR